MLLFKTLSKFLESGKLHPNNTDVSVCIFILKVYYYLSQTYHEVIDEIYYKVDHLEPWERGSRKTSGQTGMCGGVRGVGAGGV